MVYHVIITYMCFTNSYRGMSALNLFCYEAFQVLHNDIVLINKEMCKNSHYEWESGT